MPHHRGPRSWVVQLTISVPILAAAALGANRSPAQAPNASRADQTLAHRGVDEMMNGDVDAAVATFLQIQQQDPSSPLGYLLDADATWWKIYYSTANLIDPDVFDVVYASSTPYDAHFERLVKTAIEKSEQRIHAREDVAESYLYEGMAYALEGRLAGLRAKDLATARAGKQMRSLLLTALQKDPHLTDAYAGLGLYNYFVATLPTIVKMLRFLIGLPGGSREQGLEQLRKAAQQGNLVRAEATFYLAKNYTRKNEHQFGKSLALFQQLAHEFPNNPFWTLMIASLEMRLGKRAEGESTYRRVLAETGGQQNIVGQAVHRQVAQALERLHPGEKFQ
jgi:tetratricopeptide (TPR) repeat protein